MEPNQSSSTKNIGACMHLSVFTKYFIPFGNLIFPLVFWMVCRKDAFLDRHGKECLNFQISTTLYFVALAFIGFYGSLIFGVSLNGFEIIDSVDNIFQLYQFPETYPFFIFIGIIIFLAVALFFLEIICVLRAGIRAGEGKTYSYPINIPFIKSWKQEDGSPSRRQAGGEKNQSQASDSQPITPNA